MRLYHPLRFFLTIVSNCFKGTTMVRAGHLPTIRERPTSFGDAPIASHETADSRSNSTRR
jgi:hypothetical protein